MGGVVIFTTGTPPPAPAPPKPVATKAQTDAALKRSRRGWLSPWWSQPVGCIYFNG